MNQLAPWVPAAAGVTSGAAREAAVEICQSLMMFYLTHAQRKVKITEKSSGWQWTI